MGSGVGNRWIPFQEACRMHCLQQGSLNIGNTQQNRLALLASAVAEANSNPPGRASTAWATWRVGFGTSGLTTGAASGYSGAGLLIWPNRVPGFVAPPDS